MNKLEADIYWSKFGRWCRRGSVSIGTDENGEEMYSVSNGMALVIMTALVLAGLGLVSSIVFIVLEIVK